MKHRRRVQVGNIRFFIAGGTLLVATGLVAQPRFLPSRKIVSEVCQQMIQPRAILSRDQLSQLLSIPERSPKAKVRQVIKEPYCQLADLEVRDGVMAVREAYPLAFDPQTRVIVLYEGEEYAGYAFNFQR